MTIKTDRLYVDLVAWRQTLPARKERLPNCDRLPTSHPEKQVPESALRSRCGNGISGICPNKNPCQSTKAGRDS